MKWFISVLVLFVTQSALASGDGLIPADKAAEFAKLPKSVQTLMLNEARFAQKVKSLSESKETKLMNFLAAPHDCVPDDGGDSTGECHHGSYRCVPNCTWRSSSGTCLSYGSDFCGCNATCSENCTWRSSSGECLSYDADICY